MAALIGTARGCPLVYGDFTSITKIPSRPPQNAVHFVGEPARAPIITVDLLVQLGARSVSADFVCLTQSARGCARKTMQDIAFFML